MSRAACLLGMFFVSLCRNFAADDGARNGLETAGIDLKGKVKELHEYWGTETEEPRIKRRVSLDAMAHIVSDTSYDQNGGVKSDTAYAYNEAGLLTEMHGSGSDGMPRWRYAYEYASGRLAKELSYDAEGRVEWYKTYHYGNAGLLTERNTFRSNDQLTLKELFRYDDKRRRVQRTSLYADGTLLKRVDSSYTAGGLLLKEECYDAKGFYERLTYRYTETGRLSEILAAGPDGNPKRRTKRSYDGKGNLLAETLLGPDDAVIASETYTYDARGNWIRRQESSGNFVIRELSYRT